MRPHSEPARRTAGSANEREPDWSRLFLAEEPDEALEVLASPLAPEVVGVEWTPPAASVARWGRPLESASEIRRLTVDGERGGRVRVGLDDSRSRPDLTGLQRGLTVWLAFRQRSGRAARALEARARELDLLQAIGRCAAEARALPELFRFTIAALHRGAPLEAALVGYPSRKGLRLELFRGAPLDDALVDAMADRVRRFLGAADAPMAPDRHDLDGLDPRRPSAAPRGEDALLLLPLTRRGRAEACVLLATEAAEDEGHLRLQYSAANQLSLHYDRIATVQEAEEHRFRTMVDSMPQGVVLTDRELRVLTANTSARTLLERAGLPPVGADLGPLIRALGAADLVAGLGSGSVEHEARLEERVWNVTLARWGGDGAEGGLLLVLNDVTEARRLQDQLAQADKMSSLGQMISGVAHELNNPLASILGYSQLLSIKGPDEHLPDRLDVLAREAERCRKIVQNLLSFARRRCPERKPLALGLIVDNVLGLLRYQLRMDDVTVHHAPARDLPVIHGDDHQLEQVLVNLLTNARQAIAGTGQSGNVWIRTEPLDRGVALEVEDDGPGIPDEQLGRIFDPFFTTKAPGEGTGLGLSLVYGIVDAHGGTIDARRGRHERGTCFRLELPVGRPSETPGDTTQSSGADAPATPSRVLVVDDEPAIARLIADVLADEGHTTEIAAGGREALDRATRDRFDLVISDMRMPGMSGERLHQTLRDRAECRTTPMLLTTGDTFGEGPEELQRRTGLPVMAKPFELDELRRRVRDLLAGG